jgi:uncharacterized membrane protein YeiB
MAPTTILASIAGIFVAFIVAANLWRARMAHGPAEAILRVADTVSRTPGSPGDASRKVERLSDPAQQAL